MNDFDEHQLVRAMLGELADDEQRTHDDRLRADAEYAAHFAQLVALGADLRGLSKPQLQPGFDRRLAGTLRARRPADAIAQVMPRQFWRLAVPAMAAAIVLVVVALATPVTAGAEASVSLASWYPISTDPTALP